MGRSLPRAQQVYFLGNAVFDTGFIFEFATQWREAQTVERMLGFLRGKYPDLAWSGRGASYQLGGSVDNYTAPPKVGSVVSADVSETFSPRSFALRLPGGRSIDCRLSDIRANFYLFNAGVLRFRLDVPADTWNDAETLRQVRTFIQKHDHPVDRFGLSLESLFGPTIRRARAAFAEAVQASNAPLLDTPFLEYMMVLGGFETELRWAHSTLVALMPQPFDPASEHFQSTLLNVDPAGIRNFASRESHFAFVESGDSLVCVPAVEVDGRSPEQIADEDWVQWIAIHQYTWKIAWELDRGMYGVLHAATAELKQPRAKSPYRDVPALNALLNYIWLLLDTHEPHNMTLVYHDIEFLRHINRSWLTGDLLKAAREKMAALRDLIEQLDDLEEHRRARALEFFLTIVGVFSLGSLALDYLGAMSFGKSMTDLELTGVMVGVLAVFMALAYRASR
jgi:hypothetical protein